jgi:hypothetical protein
MRDHTDIEAKMIAELKDRISRHNWDWKTATNKDVFLTGMVNDKNITNLLHPLTDLHNVDMVALMDEVLIMNPVMGTFAENQPTPHNHIRTLFQPYIDWTHMGDSHFDTGMENQPQPFGIVIPNA